MTKPDYKSYTINRVIIQKKSFYFFFIIIIIITFIFGFVFRFDTTSFHFRRRVAERCHSNDDTETLMSTIITLIRWVLIDFSPTCQFGLVIEYFHLFRIDQIFKCKMSIRE